MQWMRMAACLLCAAVCLGAAGDAVAGRYHVYSCRTPSGAVAPTDGWTKSTSVASDVAVDECKAGGALVAALGDGSTHAATTDTAAWQFSAPAEEALVGATLWRAGDADGGLATNATYEFWLAGPSDTEVFDECVYEFGCQFGSGNPTTPLANENRVEVPAKNLGGSLYVNASCGGLPTYKCPSGKGDANGYAAVVYLYAADLTLEQTSQPQVANVGGELATAATLSGTADLSFEASDPVSGVYQAVFSVDGVEAGRTLIDENGGRCRDLGGASDGLPAFLYLRPCAASLSADVPLDTTALSDGAHHLVVTITDAAGNSAVALDRKIEVANHVATGSAQTPAIQGAGSTLVSQAGAVLGAANGTPASAAASLSAHWVARTHAAALTARLGSARTLTGRLLAPGGTPIAGAAVQAQFLPSALGAAALALAPAHTGADGRFTLRVSASLPSGRLTLAYNSRAGQPVPDVTAVLTLTVPASLSLRVTPHSSHASGTIHFAGALRGGPLPHGGKQLVLEARVGGGGARSQSPWRQFRVLATGAHGAYRASYRFRLPGPVTYQFRATCPHEADFPFASGSSNVVSVFER